MKISDMVIMCLRNLWRRKGRTMLTVIGVIIGCCAIIIMISLGLGMSAAMDNMLASWGDLNAVTIYGNSNYYYYDSGSSNNDDRPKLDDAALETLRSIEHVETVFPEVEVSSDYLTFTAGRKGRYRLSWPQVVGVDLSQLDKMGYAAAEGALPTGEEEELLVVFGQDMPYQFRDTKKRGQNSYTWRQQLADGTYSKPFFDPMTETIELFVNNTKKTDKNGNYMSGGRSYEYKMKTAAVLEQDTNWETPYRIYIDMDLAKELINSYNRLNGVKDAKEPEFSRIKLWVDDINHVDAVQKTIEDMGFNASSMASTRNEMQGQLGVIQMVLGCLAAISLLVAAIGITNTMIMSIYERTKEIGVMKVLGCFIGNIRSVFLMEAGMIGLLGGAIGTAISYAISAVMNSLGGEAFASVLGISTDGSSPISIIPIWLVLLALAFSSLIGLISGFYPANRAVKISALEAIRNE
ncbi:MAG: ABC transporter permease [Bacteroides sp.]|nr:ABC transporter permease [Eubacterium sp.]MCM1417875.1 ABC transporter permease [Roseburia sp.]MCM1461314.1 ABC transporter permease [Bacteroides sp.]